MRFVAGPAGERDGAGAREVTRLHRVFSSLAQLTTLWCGQVSKRLTPVHVGVKAGGRHSSVRPPGDRSLDPVRAGSTDRSCSCAPPGVFKVHERPPDTHAFVLSPAFRDSPASDPPPSARLRSLRRLSRPSPVSPVSTHFTSARSTPSQRREIRSSANPRPAPRPRSAARLGQRGRLLGGPPLLPKSHQPAPRPASKRRSPAPAIRISSSSAQCRLTGRPATSLTPPTSAVARAAGRQVGV
jgi:hypothetical protein